jgi:hypothetical protein
MKIGENLEWRIGVSADFFGSIREFVAEPMIPTQGYIPFPALEIAVTLMKSFDSGLRRGGLGDGNMLYDTQVPFGTALLSFHHIDSEDMDQRQGR